MVDEVIQDTKFVCMYEGCSRVLTTKFNLKRHIDSVHLKIRRHQCLVCLKMCASKQALNDHLNTHSGERNFVCELCGATYKHSSKLSYHRNTHKKKGELGKKIPKSPRPFSSLPYAVHDAGNSSALEHSQWNYMQLPPISFKSAYDEKLPSLADFIKGSLNPKYSS